MRRKEGEREVFRFFCLFGWLVSCFKCKEKKKDIIFSFPAKELSVPLPAD